MRVGAIVLYYNDKEGLERLLDSTDWMDTVICIDGKFDDFPMMNGSALSTDGSRQVAMAHKNVVHIDAPNRSLIDKANVGWLHAGYYLDLAITMGADEYLVGDPLEFRFNAKKISFDRRPMQITYLIEIDVKSGARPTLKKIPRIAFEPKAVRNHVTHWFRFKGSDRIPVTQTIIKGIKIVHDDKIRKPERNKLMTDYQMRNIGQERDDRLKYTIAERSTENYEHLRRGSNLQRKG